MPLNVLRLNQRHQHPTERIVFIKSLPGCDAPLAEEFLSRVAAICHPILKNNYLSVTTLEEFPANKEFIGRNFNNGECIQLVLKSHRGSWLSFRSVVMVMMHELAHNVHMNHSRDFWKIRNRFAEEMKVLWSKGYTGEGVWGPGREVDTGIRVGGGREAEAEMPEHLCGGTYRSRRRKRVRAPKLNWKEQKERRIARKFGVNGQALGEDVVDRMALQGFKGPTTKSRVAGSKRGRELRAAAALARFDQAKSGPVKREPDADDDHEDDCDDEDYEDADAGIEDAKDVDGSKLKDDKGQGMIRVCEDEDADDVHVKAEMEELNDLDDIPAHKPANIPDKSKVSVKQDRPSERKGSRSLSQPQEKAVQSAGSKNSNKTHSTTPSDSAEAAAVSIDNGVSNTCSVCSMSNDSTSLLCGACSNVLNPEKSPGSWKCRSSSCAPGYQNPADFGVCGICGCRRG